MLFTPGVWLVAFVVSVLRDSRSFRAGVYLLLFLGTAVIGGVGAVIGQFDSPDDLTGAYVLVAVLLFLLAAIVGFAGFLISSGITLLAREGRTLSHVLGLLLGIGLLVYVVAGIVIVQTNSPTLVFVFLLSLPIGYLGLGFVSFLVWGAVYPAYWAKFGPPASAVVVLGSGLIQGRVPPLLAARLDRGRAFYERALAAGVESRMVTSGGQGPDEPVSEASAMAGYLVEAGVPTEGVLTENRSRNTRENLEFSVEVLREAGITGPVAVVTNNFHALRAAMLMRKVGLPGYAVGAPTARYYWSAAVIREYIAILRDHLVFNAVAVAVLTVPAFQWAAFLVNV